MREEGRRKIVEGEGRRDDGGERRGEREEGRRMMVEGEGRREEGRRKGGEGRREERGMRVETQELTLESPSIFKK